ncbi:MAG: Pvc16 family protein [Hyphomicrobiales bacterium]
MFNDVDESLRAQLIADMPVEGNEIDISFDRPTREWANKLTKPTLNLFLFDVRERHDLRDPREIVERNANGRATRKVPPRRIDLSYMVTAWAREPADEHRILSRALASMFRHNRILDAHLKGALVDAIFPVLLRVTNPDFLAKPYELWGVLDNELHASHTLVATAPLDAYAPVEGPMVRTAQIDVTAVGEEWREGSLQIAGQARRGDTVIEGAVISVSGTALRTRTDAEGRFSFAGILPGDYTVRIELPDEKTVERKISVPASSYDVEV